MQKIVLMGECMLELRQGKDGVMNQSFDIAELVLKNGPESVYCQLDGQLTHVAITPITNVVDTTSAGDSFNGVYLGARLAGQDITSSVHLAAKAAGIVIQHPGAIAPADAFDNIHL